MKCSEVMHGCLRALAATALVATLSACGGGTEQVDPFVPVKIVAFGDESSVIESDGRKYSINAIDSTTSAVNCTANPIWMQYLAQSFAMGFAQCTSGLPVKATTLAVRGSKVADVSVAVQNYIANNTISSKDLFTVYAGQNDVIGAYEDATVTDKIAAVEAAGQALAGIVNSLARAGGRVLFVPIPDVSLTPYALTGGRDNALIKTMSTQFNTKLISNVTNDGHVIGLVSGEEMSQVIKTNPTAYGFSNITDAACINAVFGAGVVGCDALDAQLVDGAKAAKGATYFWSGDRNMSPAAHARLGQIADSRTRNNPF